MPLAPLLPLIRRFKASRRATAAVEFAIISPLFLILLFGMIAYGIYFGASHSIQQIAADAARTAVAGLDPGERTALARGYVEQNADGYPFIDKRKLTVQAAADPADANQFVVRLHYDARELPVWNLFADLPVPGTMIVRRSTIRIGGI